MDTLTTSQAAEVLGVAPVTVRLWCRQGRFPNAYSEPTPRGVIWYIPRKDLTGVEPMKPGPKPKAGATTKPKRARKVRTET
jgi:Helix-turn-helix domain